ncbi:hypothetical protein GCU56_16180 [Geodermatophilus sabuli]|uniref:Uncharacterized protein n=1 Tax=Geodermatophilus sabuli TaxID=1564158 RepID=A0A7K3W3D7_9ACTN|nr:hypothetical protein [Geodermatophilus sabuli]NEK59396.1 hypothetical protein [Geodermatophilus sabuli]
MPNYRLSTNDGVVLQEWEAGDARTAEELAVEEVTRHRMTDPPAAAEYRLEEQRSGTWATVGHWGPLAP